MTSIWDKIIATTMGLWALGWPWLLLGAVIGGAYWLGKIVSGMNDRGPGF